MPKSAFVFLNTAGTVVRTHSPDVGGGQPSAGPFDLETLITQGYVAKRELVLAGTAGVLVVLEKP
jgi:hypothetical protein